MDFYTNLTFRVQKGRGLGSRDPISKFWDPLITFELIEISTSNLADIDGGPLLRPDHKTILSGRGLGHVTKFRIL